jgi:hypothetical protein
MNVTIANIQPPQKRGRFSSKTCPFHELEETQSFIVASEDALQFPSIRSAASYYSKTRNISLSCYILENGDLQVYRNPTGQKPIEPRKRPRVRSGVVPPPPVQPPPPPDASTTLLVGPTHDQWVNMLAGMQAGTTHPTTIPSTYSKFFPQMQQWTEDYGVATNRRYSTLEVNGGLQILRGEDTMPAFVFESQAIIPADDVEAIAEDTPIDVLCMKCEGTGMNSKETDVCADCNGSGIVETS